MVNQRENNYNALCARLGLVGGRTTVKAKCPLHNDNTPSAVFSVGDDGKVLGHCHSCRRPFADLLEAIGFEMRDSFPPDQDKQSSRPKAPAKLEAEYMYTPNLKKVKMRNSDGSKYCYWQHLEGDKWVKGRNGIDPPLFTNGIEMPAVFLVEGEKDVLTLGSLGAAAVTLPDGADSKWKPQYAEYLQGKVICLIPDNDQPGIDFDQRMAPNLQGIASSVQVLDLTKAWPELPNKGDVTDLIQHMGPNEGMKALLQLVSDTPEWKPSKVNEQPAECKKHGFDVISAPDLQKAVLPPVKFLVEGFLPEGTGMISAPSKIGKSWLVLDMGMAIAAGEPFMGHQTNKNGVLYLALEDSKGRLQSRMNKVLSGRPAPQEFYFTTEAPVLGEGLLEAIEGHIKQHPETKLIIIDTLQKIRGQAQPREGAYAQDYREMGTVKAFMDRMGLSVFFVHHNRKMRDDDDPFMMISGTNGIMGAADTIMVLTKQKREDIDATLHITGRDIPQTSTVVRFNKDRWKWDAIGDADWLQEQQARQEYENSSIVKTIKKLLEQSAENQWDGTAQELMDAGRFITRTYLASSARDLSSKLKSMDKQLFDNDGIMHDRNKNGSGGGRHRFYTLGQDNVYEVHFDSTLEHEINGTNGTNDVNDILDQFNEILDQEELPFPNM